MAKYECPLCRGPHGSQDCPAVRKPARCSRPHCPCGCGSHGKCFIYGDELPEDNLSLVYSRAMNSRLALGGCDGAP